MLHTSFDRMPRDHEVSKLWTNPALLPHDQRFVEYERSRTTPPCNEGVTWLVMTFPISTSPAQIDKFAALYPYNNRFLMPLNHRHLLSSRIR